MAILYRTGTYIAFAAEGGKNITETDFKYYNLMKAMDKLKTRDFKIVNSHDKVRQIRSGSTEPTIMKTLKERIKASKNFFLLVGKKTKLDDDFVPAEIEYAAKTCGLPIIVCYVDERNRITGSIPDSLKNLWPSSLKKLMENDEVKTIHIPFKELIISQALNDFNVNSQPQYSCGLYADSVYDKLYNKGEI
jgi:MTH538 TIR-like domain (DUF1863)